MSANVPAGTSLVAQPNAQGRAHITKRATARTARPDAGFMNDPG
jgi:hypothetical protein